ncbi:MAG: lytic transglycosylase domain-containing protein [Acidimicrobiia bacterium]
MALLALCAACADADSGRRPDEQATQTSSATTAPATAAPPTANAPTDLELPANPHETAVTITRVERALRSEDPTPEQLRLLGWEQQHAYRALSVHPDWVEAVRAAVPADLAPIVSANVSAVTEIATLNQPQPVVPEWSIEAPEPLDVLLGYYREAESASGIPWPYLAAIHLVETRLGRIRGTSSAGAQGPMQFIPETWARYGQGDVNSNRDAILAAGRYLDAAGGPEEMDRALYAYNNSQHYVAAIQSYAALLTTDERVFRGYYHWQVYFATADGVALLPEGYPGVPAVAVPGPGSR